MSIVAAVKTAIKGVDVLSDLIPDKNARKAAEEALEMALVESVTAQVAVNLKEAEHDSIFVAGWRPFIGWVCGCSFAYSFVLYSVLQHVLIVAGVDPSVLPELPEEISRNMFELTLAMLGVAGYRTIEKNNGTARSSFNPKWKFWKRD